METVNTSSPIAKDKVAAPLKAWTMYTRDPNLEEKDLDGRRAHHCLGGACCGETDDMDVRACSEDEQVICTGKYGQEGVALVVGDGGGESAGDGQNMMVVG